MNKVLQTTALVHAAYLRWLGMQVQQRRADENMADWIVHITTDADRQGSDAFVQAYARCAVLAVTFQVALKAAHVPAAESKLLFCVCRSALKEQTMTDLREMLQLDGSCISQATLTVRDSCRSCTAHAGRVWFIPWWHPVQLPYIYTSTHLQCVTISPICKVIACCMLWWQLLCA